MSTKTKQKPPVDPPKDERAKDQAKAQYNSIAEMVKRLNHVGKDFNSADCQLTDAEIYAGLGLYYKKGHPTHGQMPTDEQMEEYHDEDSARQSINEDPLSVEVRSGWYRPGDKPDDEEYMILLCTGGPAVRIVGNLGPYSEPQTARLEYQDWFTPWEEYRLDHEEEQVLVQYAQQFYYGD